RSGSRRTGRRDRDPRAARRRTPATTPPRGTPAPRQGTGDDRGWLRPAAYPFEMGASTVGAVFPPALSEIADRTEVRIDAVLGAEVARWSAIDRGLEAPLTALRDLVLAGGKRLRPAFCYCAFVGAGGNADDLLVVDVGAALELLHTFALIHDDVMDASDARRGLDAVHQRFIR